MKQMYLWDVDLASVPAEHLASLVSCAKWTVDISNVGNSFPGNCDITRILDNVKCRWLVISCQTLSSEDTQALVRAMETHVETVKLGGRGEVSLDITALTQYSGRGRCEELICYNETAKRYQSWHSGTFLGRVELRWN